MRWRVGALACTVLCLAAILPAAAAEQTWLVASDLHVDPFARSPRPALFGSDANEALYRSALAQMKREVPDPAVVLLPGDFLAHDFPALAREAGSTPEAATLATMRAIAADFARAYPSAQIAIALGNNDSPCGDYSSDNGSAYARALAAIWKPLVDRNGAAPDFEQTFSSGGYYAARLPLNGLRLVTLDTVIYSQEYRGDCGAGGAGAQQLAWLQATLRATPPGVKNVVMMHVPFGYDAVTTEALHGFVAWPFLRWGAGELVATLGDPANQIALGIAGHEHRFDFRLAGDVPYLILGSISPVYHNNPAFYALHVDSGGTLRDVDTYVFDEWTQAWEPARSFDQKWAVTQIDASSLRRIHRRLAADRQARAAWNAQADAWPSNPAIAWSQWTRGSWRTAWCAQTALGDAFVPCAGLVWRVALFEALAPLAALAPFLPLVALAGWIASVAHRRRRAVLANRRAGV